MLSLKVNFNICVNVRFHTINLCTMKINFPNLNFRISHYTIILVIASQRAPVANDSNLAADCV